MKRNRMTQIGLDRLLRLQWLEKVLLLASAGNDAKSIKTVLQQDLSGEFRSERTDVRGSLDKIITVLRNVWLTVPPEIEEFRRDGVTLLQSASQQSRVAVHWGMVMAAYPFWAAVATQAGRLLRLQGTVPATQVQRRIMEQYGERETVSRRARYVLRSFLDWGVLRESGSKGIYSQGDVVAVEDLRLIAWLAEAALYVRPGGSGPLKELMAGPSFFPFRFAPIRADSISDASSRLDVFRLGLDEDLLMLRKKNRNE